MIFVSFVKIEPIGNGNLNLVKVWFNSAIIFGIILVSKIAILIIYINELDTYKFKHLKEI